jgi:hypothetical protein
MDDLDHIFAGRGIRRGGVLMLRAPDAIAYIEAARHRGIPVLGVDSFVVTEHTTKPLMEHSINLSCPGTPTDTWLAARNFVEQRGDSGFVFEIVA